jgi:hypothetical protein
VCAAGTLGWEIAHSNHPLPRASPAAPTPKVKLPQPFRILDTTSDELLTRATERHPFSHVVHAPPPTQPVGTAPTAVSTDTLRVLGTVVDSLGGSFALCQLGAAPPVLLRTGQKIGEYELRSVDKAIVVFSTIDGRRAERRVPRAGE